MVKDGSGQVSPCLPVCALNVSFYLILDGESVDGPRKTCMDTMA